MNQPPGTWPTHDNVPSAQWREEVRAARPRLDVRWRAEAGPGFCQLSRPTASGAVVELRMIGRRRAALIDLARLVDRDVSCYLSTPVMRKERVSVDA